MGERTKLIASINDVVDNSRILQGWMIEENARMKYEGQMAYAREEGLKQGIEQGTLKGIEDTKLEIIKNMLIKKYSYVDISELTGKSVEEIKEIENSMEE